MINTEFTRFFRDYERVLELLSYEDCLFGGAYVEESKSERRELLKSAKSYLVMESFKRNVVLSELEKILFKEMPSRLFNSYVQPLFMLFRNY
jgi:hypothetical protein